MECNGKPPMSSKTNLRDSSDVVEQNVCHYKDGEVLGRQKKWLLVEPGSEELQKLTSSRSDCSRNQARIHTGFADVGRQGPKFLNFPKIRVPLM